MLVSRCAGANQKARVVAFPSLVASRVPASGWHDAHCSKLGIPPLAVWLASLEATQKSIDMSVAPCQVRYFDNERNAARASGAKAIKLYLNEQDTLGTGRVAIQMREICEQLAKDPKKWLMHEWWKSKQEWAMSFLSRCDIVSSHIRPSQKSLACRTGNGRVEFEGLSHLIQIEWTTSLRSMMFLLVHWGVEAHQKAVQGQAANLFRDLLQLVWGSRDVRPLWQSFMWEERVDDLEEPLCEAAPDCAETSCPRTERVTQTVLHNLQLPLLVNIQGFIFDLCSCQGQCKRLGRWFVDCVVSLTDAMGSTILEGDAGLVNPELLNQLSGASKKRRLDPELHRAAASAIKSGRFRPCQAMARSGVLAVPARTAQDFDLRMLVGYLHRTKELAGATKQLSVALDGSTIGGEDSTFFASWFWRAEVGAWLPMQAPASVDVAQGVMSCLFHQRPGHVRRFGFIVSSEGVWPNAKDALPVRSVV